MIRSFLLVDDDADDAGIFCEAMAETHPEIECNWATDGKDALNKLNNNLISKPDLIVMDINMPGMNGWECLTKLKADNAYKDIPVVVYSTSSHKRNTEIAKDLGALSFFVKPDNYTLLRGLIQQLVSAYNEGTIHHLSF